MRLAFAGVNFTIVVFAMLWVYTQAAQRVQAEAVAEMEHEHGVFEVPAGVPTPTLTIDVQADSMDGWNVHLATTNFHFAPTKAGGANEPGHGHAHLHIDGAKSARLYAPWHHLPKLPPGKHEIRVSLNTNDHSVYAKDGKPIEAVATIEQK
jgi:hypothetical protein